MRTLLVLRPWRICASSIEIRRSLATPWRIRTHPIGAGHGFLVSDLPGCRQAPGHARVLATAKLGGQPLHPPDRGQDHPQRVLQRGRVVPIQIQRGLQASVPSY
jgi:hypothetical protein